MYSTCMLLAQVKQSIILEGQPVLFQPCVHENMPNCPRYLQRTWNDPTDVLLRGQGRQITVWKEQAFATFVFVDKVSIGKI